ncbi:MAG: phosphoribosylanthranilate isomerase [Clostridia bacterium]|nr:phosphoribosylanthranilate isomerase [Clostridia bacterium]
MTKIKLCGLKRPCDIEFANLLKPDYIGFVFAPKSRRYITFIEADKLRDKLDSSVVSVGVFVNEATENIVRLANKRIIGAVQLHGTEDNTYIEKLRSKIDCPIIQAFSVKTDKDIEKAKMSIADYIMLDSGGGTGTQFNHLLIKSIGREFFLAGGLDSRNVKEVIYKYTPYAVDASSSLETDGVKDKDKMAAFVKAVRNGGK